jgi:hypothetical protein
VETELDVILRDLLARQDLSAETRAELADFQEQAQAGGLDAADRAYVVALSNRLSGKPVASEGVPLRDEEEEDPWRARALEAEAKLQALQAAVERVLDPAGADEAEAAIRTRLRDSLTQEWTRIEQGEG